MQCLRKRVDELEAQLALTQVALHEQKSKEAGKDITVGRVTLD